jgi:hypothetical protein
MVRKPGDAEHLVARGGPGEHHADALPYEKNHGERNEEAIADADEAGFLRGEERGDRLLDGGDGLTSPRSSRRWSAG